MILYLDTSSSYLYSAIYDNDSIIDSISANLGKDLSSKTLIYIREMINKNNLELSNIKKIIVVNGPGSFTGIRVGLTIAKVLAWSLDIPITTISSLEAMALSYIGDINFIIPAIDARRDYYYATIYDKNNRGFILKEQYISKELLLSTIASLPMNSIIVTNDKFDSDYETTNYTPNYLNIIKTYKDKEPIEVHLIDANYLKKTEAESKNDN